MVMPEIESILIKNGFKYKRIGKTLEVNFGIWGRALAEYDSDHGYFKFNDLRRWLIDAVTIALIALLAFINLDQGSSLLMSIIALLILMSLVVIAIREYKVTFIKELLGSNFVSSA